MRPADLSITERSLLRTIACCFERKLNQPVSDASQPLLEAPMRCCNPFVFVRRCLPPTRPYAMIHRATWHLASVRRTSFSADGALMLLSLASDSVLGEKFSNTPDITSRPPPTAGGVETCANSKAKLSTAAYGGIE